MHRVRSSDKRLKVTAVNLSGSIADICCSIANLAQRVRDLRSEAPRHQEAPRRGGDHDSRYAANQG